MSEGKKRVREQTIDYAGIYYIRIHNIFMVYLFVLGINPLVEMCERKRGEGGREG